ncbi:MAG TPA: T9SS type B sorting domain-containing protein [Flavobacterium sp.]|uniref:T9SS type B sorting domain-containing protein n=1 Tax=Flavobacterium sp. TaxID=239 RepID=UPI002C97BBC6|nr:T9SS type B sorting domain-containing protein [Flavobacterium sp.]HSD13688.1 T9SS type B sorting domain-containing protein [Flavobacterium sp.]
MNLITKTIFFILFTHLSFQIGYTQNNCSDAIVVCGNSNFSGLSTTGIGIQELDFTNNDCSSMETNSLWLKVPIATNGTLAFELIPQSSSINVDFDFFIFGPNATCANLGHSIRCSTTNPAAAGLSNNKTGLNTTETDTSEGPGTLGNSFVQAINALAGETYFIVIDRPVGTSNFSINWTGTATFTSPPTINGNNLDVSNCDSGVNDNITSFDFTQTSSLAIGNQTGVSASFHTSVNDAITGTNQIPDITNFQNTTNPQTVYIRLTNTASGCFATSDFNLHVTQYQTNTPSNLEKCDLDNDGFVTFNLRDNDSILTGGDPNIVITYHPTANSGITLPDNYTNAVPGTNETVWAKITNTAIGCYAEKPFNLILKRIPPVTAAQLTQCDFQLNPDSLTTFNLSEANGTLTGNNPNYSIEFYTLGSTTPLNSVYTNIQNPQTLTVKITDNTTQCYAFTTLTLNVTVNPTIIAALHECDADGTEDGFTTFDLTDTGFAITGNIVTYFTSSNDALLEENEIPTNFINTVEDNQRLFARIENGNDCIGINIVDLFVDPLPNIDIDDNAVFCLNEPNVPVTLNAGIGLQNPNSFTYLWSPGGETTQTIDVLASGTYTVTVTNSLSCSKERTVVVKDSDIALIESVSVLDLSENNAITVYVQGDENEFEYSLDSPTGPFQTSNHFENVTPGIHTVYINDIDGCGVTPKEISVLGVPKFFTPNGDGYNDTWVIKGTKSGFYTKSKIQIFDRFGKLLKEMAFNGEGWNGIFNGQPLPATDYWYILKLEDGRTVKGHFALKR